MTQGFFYYLIMAGLFQNLLLTTGFGTSLMLRISERKKDIWLFNIYLTVFSLVVSIVSFFLDNWLEDELWYMRYCRPLLFTAVTVVLYIIMAVAMWKFCLSFYRRCKMYMSLAVFNNIILGVALVSNLRFVVTLPELIGFSLGSSVGFAFMLQLYIHARPRLYSVDVPAAFRGLPVSLLYMGILSLALTGFVSVVFV